MRRYPDNNAVPPAQFEAFIYSYLYDHAQLAHAQGKPLVVEEFG